MSHRHRFRRVSLSGKEIEYRCGCGEAVTRKTTKQEERWVRRHFMRMLKPPPKHNVHRVWHRVRERLVNGWQHVTDQNRKLEYMAIMEKMARYYPGEVVVTRCDDSWHAGSRIALVTHEAQQEFMGTTVLMFPQCDGRPPAEFFLYPEHLNALVRALQVIQRRTRRKNRKRRMPRRKNWAEQGRPATLDQVNPG